MNDVMLDLETIGKGPTAAIVSIGAVFFAPETNTIGAEFYLPIDLKSAARYGEIDASTVKWWMKQVDDARSVFDAPDQVSLPEALAEFDEWISQIENIDDRLVWGNGATFDNVILGNAYRATKQRQPWQHFGNRDVRTIVDLGRRLRNVDPKKEIELAGTAHNALDDARHQARYVSAIYQALKNEIN